MDFKPINSGIANRCCHTTRHNITQWSAHAFVVLFDRFAFIKGKKTSQSLRDGLGLNNCCRLINHFCCRLSRHQDIFVVWQDNDVARIQLFNRFDKVFCWWVHGLTTRDDVINSLRFKDISQSLTSNYCDDGIFFFFNWFGLTFFFFNLRFVLVTHVVDFHLDQASVLKTFLHDKTWIFCMDVNFDNLIVIHHQ